jgi:esterase/lipase superfamily enzyme
MNFTIIDIDDNIEPARFNSFREAALTATNICEKSNSYITILHNGVVLLVIASKGHTFAYMADMAV